MLRRLPFGARAVSVLVFMAAPASSYAQRIHPAPQLRAGQTLVYQLEFHSVRTTNTESRVTAPQLPSDTDLTAICLLQVSVVEAGGTGFRLKTYLSENAPPAASRDPSNTPTQEAPDKQVDAFIAMNGTASEVQGLERLSAAEQFAWNSWLSRFTSSMTYPKGGIRAGQRWEVSEREAAPSPIAGLFWKKNYQYVRDEPCAPANVAAALPGKGSAPAAAQTCAVIFARASLRQKSSPKNATPQDYKLRNLITRGAASGTNETILYLSKATGLLVRSTEDSQQSMDATVALADGSNQVRYLINAKSHSRIQLLPDAPQDVR